jgi:hypothetical protein
MGFDILQAIPIRLLCCKAAKQALHQAGGSCAPYRLCHAPPMSRGTWMPRCDGEPSGLAMASTICASVALSTKFCRECEGGGPLQGLFSPLGP